jgi:hypothetical protein
MGGLSTAPADTRAFTQVIPSFSVISEISDETCGIARLALSPCTA